MINVDTAFRYRLKLSKAAGVTSHKFVPVLAAAVTQSGLKYILKKNHPRVYVYLGAAEDEESLTEIAEIFLKNYVSPEEVKTKLLPFLEGSGFVLKEIELLPYHLSNVQNLVSHVCYQVTGVRGSISRALSLCPKINRKHLYSIERLNADEVKIIMKLNPSGSFSSVQELLKLLGLDVGKEDYKAIRMALYWVDKNGALQPL
ncbi:MAG: hypothetical protein J5594_00445 [Elusimicrobiaceae bacterium]|nr:hypothetical protein [Elusimicrobiaceae bacterium]